MRCAVFSCRGLGDGLIALVLSNNLQKHGWDVVTYHPTLTELQSWFPTLTLASFPDPSLWKDILQEYDRIFLFWEMSSRMQDLFRYCKTHHPSLLTVFNPIATSRRDCPFWEEGRFEGNKSLAENLLAYCTWSLHLSSPSLSNGIKMPSFLIRRRYLNRVVVHPTSSRAGKNWPFLKYKQIMERLIAEGYEPIIIASLLEQQALGITAPLFASLSELAALICESGYFIGNDSGIGHLASSLGLPTITICRHAKIAKFWQPAWSKGIIVAPPFWIPNIKGLRLRDRYWGRWISEKSIWKAFLTQVDQRYSQ